MSRTGSRAMKTNLGMKANVVVTSNKPGGSELERKTEAHWQITGGNTEELHSVIMSGSNRE